MTTLADIKMSLHDIISRIKLVDDEVLPHSEKREIIDKLYDIENILAFNEEGDLTTTAFADSVN